MTQAEIGEDLVRIARQEQQLQFPRFDSSTAWAIGVVIRELAVARGHVVVIDVRRFGHQLFFSALDGTTPDNLDWVRRKANVVAHFLRCSYAIGLDLENKKSNLMEKYGLSPADYVSHGGSFPINVAGAGVIGAVTVSGLPQRSDHALVVEGLCAVLGVSYEELKLAAAE